MLTPPFDQGVNHENCAKNVVGHSRFLGKKMDTTSRIDVSNWWRSHELFGVGCGVKVRNLGQTIGLLTELLAKCPEVADFCYFGTITIR